MSASKLGLRAQSGKCSGAGRPEAACPPPLRYRSTQHAGRLRQLGRERSRLELALQSQGRSRAPSRISCLRSGAVSDYNKAAPRTAWSPLRSLQSLSKFFFISGAATTAAWNAHPHLLNLAAHVLNLDFKDNVTAFQTSFFSFLSLVFAIYSGNTMAFLYDRQKGIVEKLYAECMALEELLEEAVNTLGPDARDILGQIRQYIDHEMYQPENQSPPLGEGHPLSTIRAKARNYRRAGTDVGEILQASQRLAHAQSARQATACRLLPPVHWALLYTIGALFVSTFILFETGGSFSNEGRHILFTVLCGLMSFVLVALRDLADPVEGVYNATALLAERMTYINSMLNKYEKLPNRSPTSAALLGTSVPLTAVPSADDAGAEQPESALDFVERLPNLANGEGLGGGLMGALAGLMSPDTGSSESSPPSDDSSSSGSGSGGGGGSGGVTSVMGPASQRSEGAEAATSGNGMGASAAFAGPAEPAPFSAAAPQGAGSSSGGGAVAMLRGDAALPSGERTRFSQFAMAGGQAEAAPMPAPASRLEPGVRSSIVERRPNGSKGRAAPAQARQLLRVASLEEQIATIASRSAAQGPASRWPNPQYPPRRQALRSGALKVQG